MKKLTLFYVIMFMSMFLFPYNNVDAELKLEFTKDDTTNCKIDGLTFFKRTKPIITNNGSKEIQRIVYCYDEDDSFPISGTSLTWSCKSMDEYEYGISNEEIIKLKYVIATGFNTSEYDNLDSNMKNEKKCSCDDGKLSNLGDCKIYNDYLATQKAVWNISSSTKSTENFDSELTEKAKEYFNKKGGAEIKLSTNDKYMYSDGDYFVSNWINVNTEYAGEMEITLPDNFYAEDVKGNKKITVRNGDVIRVKVKNDEITTSNITLQVSYEYTYNAGDIYLCNNGNSDSGIQRLVWYEPHEEKETVVGKLKLELGYKCSNNYQNSGKLVCNQNNNYSSTCDHLTINVRNYKYKNNTYNFFANITFNQTGDITSVLNPETTYSGGGFNFNVIYYNQISWDYYNGGNKVCKDSKGNNCINLLDKLVEDSLMNQRIFNMTDYKNNIIINNVKFGDTTFDKGFIKKCSGDESFINKKITSTCVFTLPKEILEDYTGIVTEYITDSGYLNTANKHYTPINFEGKYNITASINGLSRLKNKPQDNIGSKPWFGEWNDTFEDCIIDLYPLYGRNVGNKNNFKYIFIYRPIDLDNPFPNRNAGMNWYDWYNVASNKERLESSYSREQYSITLDGQKTSEIKKYNKNELNKGGYFDWNNIEDGQSSFINKYFDKKRDNIVGDNS